MMEGVRTLFFIYQKLEACSYEEPRIVVAN